MKRAKRIKGFCAFKQKWRGGPPARGTRRTDMRCFSTEREAQQAVRDGDARLTRKARTSGFRYSYDFFK